MSMSGRHRDFLPILLGVFGMVTTAGIINSEFLAAISPRHYQVYYPPIFPWDAPWAQALCFAMVVVGGAGFAWASLLYWVGHYGPGPAIGVKTTLQLAAIVVGITLLAAWGLGWRTWVTGIIPYSEFFYPSNDRALCFSETVELTDELVGLAGSGLLLAGMAGWRWSRSK